MTALIAAALLAHTPSHPKRLLVTVASSAVIIVARIAIAPGDPARLFRTLFDRDRDGEIGPVEGAAAIRHLSERATRALLVLLNGRQLSFPEIRSAAAGVVGRVGGPDGVDLEVALVSPGARIRFGRNSIRVGDIGFERGRDVPVSFHLALAGATRGAGTKIVPARGEAVTFDFMSFSHGR